MSFYLIIFSVEDRYFRMMRNWTAVVLLVTFTFSLPINTETSTRCYAGYLYNPKTDDCEPCFDGSFLELRPGEHDHNMTKCEFCSTFNPYDPTIEKVADCTKEHDLKVRCIDGWYRDENFKRCNLCTDCSRLGKFLAKDCTREENTKCCPKPGMPLFDGQCVEMVHCSYGEFYRFLGFKDGVDHGQCLRCATVYGSGLTNNLSRHRRRRCKNKHVTKKYEDKETYEGIRYTDGPRSHKKDKHEDKTLDIPSDNNRAAIRDETWIILPMGVALALIIQTL